MPNSPLIWFGNAGKFLKPSLVMPGSTSGALTLNTAAVTTSYSLTMPAAQGGSGQTLVNNGSGILSWAAGSGMTNPMTTIGDLIYGDTGGTPLRLPIGTDGDVLSIVAGIPAWTTPSPTIAASYHLAADVSASPTQPIDFATQVLDTDSAVTTGSAWKFTAPRDGIYFVSATGILASGSQCGLTLYKNGSSLIDLCSVNTSLATCGSAIVELVATDYIDIRTTGSVTFDGTSDGGKLGTVNIACWANGSGGGGGSGDVVGPSSAVDNGIARFDGTTGKLIQDSPVTLDDSGVLSRTAAGNSITIRTANSSSPQAGTVDIFAGDTTSGSNAGGNVLIHSGNGTSGGSGLVQVYSADSASSSNNTGNVTVHSGTSTNRGSGSLSLFTGDADTDSGNVSIFTGAGVNTGGNIVLTAGTGATADDQGAVTVNARVFNMPTGTADPAGTLQAGSMYYNTSTSALRIYDGAAWSTV